MLAVPVRFPTKVIAVTTPLILELPFTINDVVAPPMTTLLKVPTPEFTFPLRVPLNDGAVIIPEILMLDGSLELDNVPDEIFDALI